jgi:hypothetical protein
MLDFSSSFRSAIKSPLLPTFQGRKLEPKMAEDSGVTAPDLEAKLKSSLDATHVEIEDMSGTYSPATYAIRLIFS